MILIEKNSYNMVALSLKEKSTLQNPYYLFVFKNNANDIQKLFTCSYSAYTINSERCYIFEILETLSEDLLNGMVYLSGNSAQMNYEIYESEVPFYSNALYSYNLCLFDGNSGIFSNTECYQEIWNGNVLRLTDLQGVTINPTGSYGYSVIEPDVLPIPFIQNNLNIETTTQIVLEKGRVVTVGIDEANINEIYL